MPKNSNKKVLSLHGDGQNSSSASLSSEESTGLLSDLLDSMEQGILLWDAEGYCSMHNERVYEVLELSQKDIHKGVSRIDLLRMAVDRGEFTREVADTVKKQFQQKKPFSFERIMPSGRKIITAARPRDCGGYVVTFSDITLLKEREAELSDAKNRAELAEAELGKQLQFVNEEKTALEKQQILLSRLSMVATHAKDYIAITNEQGQISWINGAFARVLGNELGEVQGLSLVNILGGVDPVATDYDSITDGIANRSFVKTEIVCKSEDSNAFWMELELSPVFSESGEHTNFVAVGRDTTKRKTAEQEANKARDFEVRKQQEAMLLAEFNGWLQASDSLSELFQVVSSFLNKLIPSSSGAVYVYANSRDVLESVCNWNNGLMASNFEPSACWALRRGRNYYYGENEVDFACQHVEQSHGDQIPARHYCLPIIAHGDTVGLLCIDLPAAAENDIDGETKKLANFCSEQISIAIANVQLREQLLDQSTRDALTSLFNRRYFIECVRRELINPKKNKISSIISFDVDHFKKFNDTFGHDAGDTVLRAISEALVSSFRDSDIPCRYGGEEFAIFLPGASAEIAIKRAKELGEQLEKTTVRYGGDELSVTISSGVATYPSNGSTVQSLIKSSDQALYAAKENGRNNVVHIDELSDLLP